MKQIWFAIMFAAVSVNIAFTDEVDFTGEWFVESADAGDSGIAVTLTEDVYRPGQIRETYRPDGTFVRMPPIGKREVVFVVIPAGTFFDFAVNGSKLTGTIVRDTEEPILNGKISGNKITFTVMETIRENAYSYSYTGKLSDDGIHFEVRPPANGGKRFQFMAKRLMP
jgi:hypothetical protein